LHSKKEQEEKAMITKDMTVTEILSVDENIANILMGTGLFTIGGGRDVE